MKKISFLGCGKLGLPVALHFLDQGYLVKGSTTQESKTEKLKNFGTSLI